jgi:hypothetical protein
MNHSNGIVATVRFPQYALVIVVIIIVQSLMWLLAYRLR